ncbi:MAG: hypothetical protein ACRD4Y_05855 [Candidatus Acidiferrales bacterium]
MAKRLEGRGCTCKFASSYQEAVAMYCYHDFDLVLSPTKVRERSTFPLLSLLERSRTTLFYYLSVERGCWWLPALHLGRKCLGSYAMRPSEFIASLDVLVDEIRAGSQASAKSAGYQPMATVESAHPEYSALANMERA